MTRPAEPEWHPEYIQEPPLESVSPEDWIPNPKSVVAALKASPALFGLGTAATRAFGREIVPEVLKAEQRLSPKAKQFSNNWNMNWNRGQREFIESPEGHEIDAAFDPVREKIRRIYGNTMPLFRGERGPSNPDKVLFSWTPDRQLAQQFASNSSKFPTPITDEAIAEAVRNYNRRGFTTFGNAAYKRNPEYPEYANIFDRRSGQLVTDTDNLEKHLLGEQKDRAEYLAKLLSKGTLHEADVPVESMFWIPTGYNLKEPEIISRFNPRIK
jgi:hypothetical protein